MNALWARLIVEEFLRLGVGGFFLSPGSRSTPLALAVAESAPAVCVVHLDERGTAFHALGHAKASGKPSVLICTSGTAAANYLPAVVEASNAGVPLIVLTADRPPELLDCGANQAIDQVRMFGVYPRWTAELPCPDASVPPAFVLTTVDQAFRRATGPEPGPVHLNCPYREPLVPPSKACNGGDYLAPLASWQQEHAPYTRHRPPVCLPDDATLADAARQISETKCGLLVVGELAGPREQEAVSALACRLGWPTVPDILSGLRLGAKGAPWLPLFDQMLLSPALPGGYVPSTMVHIGGPVVSKRLQQYLERTRPYCVRLESSPARHDPGHLVRLRLEGGIAATCQALAERVASRQAPFEALTAAHTRLADALNAWLDATQTLTEMHVARTASLLRPAGGTLFLGNSMPIRDMDMYGDPNGPGGPVFANRGASGIDGNIATAAGCARALGGPALAIVGDLTALHDLNSLAFLRGWPDPFVLVVVNNDGGGIFSFLPVSEQETPFEAFFGTPHGLGFEGAAHQFGLNYARPETREAFARALREGFDHLGATLVEVRTSRGTNHAMHQALQEALR